MRELLTEREFTDGEAIWCLSCGHGLTSSDVVVLRQTDEETLLHAKCHECRIYGILCGAGRKPALPNRPNVRLVITDVNADDVPRLIAKGGTVTADDVLDIHHVLAGETKERDFIDEILDTM